MTVSNLYNCVNFKGQEQSVNLNRPQLPPFIPKSKYARQMATDVFIKLDNQYKTEAAKEIDTLFPNGELNKIYDKITEAYGIENPPQFIIADNNVSNAAASYNQEHNTVKFNPRFINKLNNFKKTYVEFQDANGKIISGYTPDPDVRSKIGFMTTEQTYLAEKDFFDKKGIKSRLEPYNDDDKRKYIIFVLAHELRHALQAQIINRSEGLGMYNLLKEKDMQEAGNLIERKLTELNFDKKYRILEWSKYPQTVIYEKGSKKWEIGNEFYKASLNYTDPNQNALEYHLNLTEADANNSAEKYLDKDYNGFDKLLKGEDLDAFLQKVKI